ncbi:MAG: hypothetical protein KGH69_03125 [Candidatus Micrarchaeota archaeon]|nr:hypothetical protein [Candidatus Micrarchaeota archaeon]
MNSKALLTSLIAIFMVTNLSFAYDVNLVNALLHSYNVSDSQIASYKMYNTTYNGTPYVLVYGNGKPLFLVKAVVPYSFKLNSSNVSKIIKSYIVANSLEQVNGSNLFAQMHLYEDSSSTPLNDCLFETGLSTNNTCTLSNYCSSCSLVPICKKALGQTGGPSGPIGTGVMQLETAYDSLAAAYSAFYSATANLNVSNANQQISSIQSAFSTISSTTGTLGHNPLFPPPASSDYTQCLGYGSSTSNTVTAGPWYCNSVGFCAFLTYNTTLLATMQSEINSIGNLPLTDAQITAIAKNITSNENSFVAPILQAEQQHKLDIILNTTLANYTNITTGATVLLMHVDNTSISKALNILTSNYFVLTDDYLEINLTQYNKTVGSQLQNLTALYLSANALYSSIAGVADNNTALLLEAQLANPKNPDPKVSSLSFQQAQLNLQTSGKISNLSYTKATLFSINANAKSILAATFANPLVELARSIDMPIILAIEGPSQASYASKVSSVPLYSALVSLGIGIVVILLLTGLYAALHRQRRIRMDHRASRAWKLLFATVLAIVLIYVCATYVLASDANTTGTLSGFKSAVAGSANALIAVNGTPTQAMSGCATKLTNALAGMNKNVSIAYITGDKCVLNSGVRTTDSCLNSYASKNAPIIMLQSGSTSSVSVYSFYGTTLKLQGDDNFMNYCVATAFLK